MNFLRKKLKWRIRYISIRLKKTFMIGNKSAKQRYSRVPNTTVGLNKSVGVNFS